MLDAIPILEVELQSHNTVAVYEKTSTGIFPRIGRVHKDGDSWCIITPKMLAHIHLENVVKIVVRKGTVPIRKTKTKEVMTCKKKKRQEPVFKKRKKNLLLTAVKKKRRK